MMRAWVTIESGQAIPTVCELEANQVVKLGRNRSNTIVLHDQHASRWHAEIVPEEGRWLLRDCGTTNGTRLNGLRIQEKTPLGDGSEIRIGDTRLRFHVESAEAGTAEFPKLEEVPRPELTPDLSPTTLQPDELTALFSFMDGSLKVASAQHLVGLALTAVHNQTGASVTGFLSLDEDDPLPKMVLPDLVHVDIHLSRQLTQSVQRENRTVWLASGGGNVMQSDSLVSFRDAVCVPVQAGEAPLGALHVYKAGKAFHEREVRFCEVLAGYLAKSLHLLRIRRALEADNSRLRVHAPGGDHDLIGESAPMRHLKQQIRRLAERPNVILIHGESGSGKELVALALHRLSTRREGPLVTVNCAAIAASLPEAE